MTDIKFDKLCPTSWHNGESPHISQNYWK